MTLPIRPLNSDAQKWYDEITELLEKACEDLGFDGEAMALCYNVSVHADQRAEDIVKALES